MGAGRFTGWKGSHFGDSPFFRHSYRTAPMRQLRNSGDSRTSADRGVVQDGYPHPAASRLQMIFDDPALWPVERQRYVMEAYGADHPLLMSSWRKNMKSIEELRVQVERYRLVLQRESKECQRNPNRHTRSLVAETEAVLHGLEEHIRASALAMVTLSQRVADMGVTSETAITATGRHSRIADLASRGWSE